MTGAETLRNRANATPAALALATLLRSRTLQIVLTGVSTNRWLLRWTCSRPFQVYARWTADSVFLSRLHQTTVHRRTGWFAGGVSAEERPRRVGDLQRLACRADRRQGLRFATAGNRRTWWTGAGHVGQLARLACSWTGDAATGIATLAPRATGCWLDLVIVIVD